MLRATESGSPVQSPLNPGLVHFNVEAPVLAGPLKLPVAEHRPPPERGPENVNVPVKLSLSTFPSTVPFQSVGPAHVPVTDPADCVRLTLTAMGFQLDESNVPVQLPPIWAKFSGAVGLDPHALTSAHTNTPMTNFFTNYTPLLTDRVIV